MVLELNCTVAVQVYNRMNSTICVADTMQICVYLGMVANGPVHTLSAAVSTVLFYHLLLSRCVSVKIFSAIL